MASVRALLRNLATSGFPSGSDGETLHRLGMINTFSGLGVLYMLGFAILDFHAGRESAAAILMGGALLIAANVLYLRVTRRLVVGAWVGCTVATVVFVTMLHHGEEQTFGHLWCAAFPLFAAFALGLRAGAVANAVFFALCALALYVPDYPWMLADYSPELKLRVLSLLLALSVMSLYAEYARMATDRAAQSSQRRFRSLIENGASVHAVVGSDGTVEYESPSVRRIFGYRAQELIGTSVLARVHPQDRTAARQEFDWLLRNPGATKTVEMRYRHRDGTWRDIEVSGVSLLHDPAVRGVVLSSHDVTERKQAERGIRALNETLEERVKERTEELHRREEQLRQAEKMEAIGRLAGGVAHDFNNQLAAITCCLDILKLGLPKTSKLTGHVHTAMTAARRAADLTAQLLAFARRSSRRHEPVEVHGLIKEVVSLLEHSIDKRIAIEQDLAGPAPVVLADSGQLQSALLNLALNARDAMPTGGTMRFSTTTVEFDDEVCKREALSLVAGSYLRVDVMDTGCGIDEETRRHIFEPFFTTKARGAGTGMGLAAVYGTARMHGGAVKVESAVGRGSTFSLYVPLAADAAPAPTEEPVPPISARQAVQILLVDDEETVLQSLGPALEALDYSVTSCRDGAEAVVYYREHWRQVDVVVLDMMMPRMTGKETFEQLRDVNPDARVILISGYSVDGSAEQALEAGALAFLEKPFPVAELAERISEAVPRAS